MRRTRAPRSPLRARHVPVVHAERGREDHGVHGYRPRPRGSRAEHGARVRRRSLHPCTRLTVRGSRAQPKPPQARTARARGVGRVGAGGPHGPWLSPTPTRIPRCAQRAHARHHIAFHAGRQEGSRLNPPPQARTARGPDVHTPREGGSAVRPVAPSLGPQGEHVTHALVRRGARDARGRELSF